LGLLDISLLAASVAIALVSRMAMKRFVARRLGKASDYLLETDFWKAASGKAIARVLLLVELLSWASILFLVAKLAARTLGA
jgi:hypothetical protein